MLLQLLLNGLISGCLISLAALGFSLIYNPLKIFHIVYAFWYMLSAYLTMSLMNMGLNVWISGCLSVVIVGVLSVVHDFLIYRPLKGKGEGFSGMISAIGCLTVGVNIVAMVYGNETQVLQREISQTYSVGSLIITEVQLFQLICCVVVFAGFYLTLKVSSVGLKVRAVRDDAQLFAVCGGDSARLRILLFAVSGAFGALAGVLNAYDYGMDPHVGMPILINAIVAIIIGGVGNFLAPVIGGILIGVMQSLVIWKFSSRWQDSVVFFLLILFLIFRPQGILGKQMREV